MAIDKFVVDRTSPNDLKIFKNGNHVGGSDVKNPNRYVIELQSSAYGGGGGGGATVESYTHTQSVPLAVWNVNHGLGRNPVSVTVYDSTNTEVIGFDLVVVDNNNITISFGGAFSGKAYII